MDPVTITWNTNKKTGKIRKLNGGNLAPNIANEMGGMNIRKSFAELNLAFTRLHDAPLTNPGCRLVDISHIFPLFYLDANDPRNYDFSYTDDYIRNCIEDCNTPIFYRLGESIDHSVNTYKITPPSDVNKWIDICSNIIRHYTEGLWNGFHFKIEYWEIWNEPECGGNKRLDPNAKNLMWLGTIDEFNAFFVQVAAELKKRFPHLKFGGPAHCCFNNGADLTEAFIKYCADHRAPLDFYSYHCYTGDPYGSIQETPGKTRELLDKYGYTEAEIHLNEWHYFPGDWHRLRNDRDYKTHMYEQEMKGLDSAAFLTTVMILWQDTPLTYGAYYTCVGGGWGCYRTGSNAVTPSWYGLKAYGDIVRYPVRTVSTCGAAQTTVLSGRNAAGGHALLIAGFSTGDAVCEVTLDRKIDKAKCKVRLLDELHLFSPVEDAEIAGNKIRFTTLSNSFVALIELEK